MSTHNICFHGEIRKKYFLIEKKKAPHQEHCQNHWVYSDFIHLNTNGSFTIADWNSFLNRYEILLIAQENKYLGILEIFFFVL